jgi:hypothetical protein
MILKHLPLNPSLVLIRLLISEELLSAPPSVHHTLGIFLLSTPLLLLTSTTNDGMKRALLVDLDFLLQVRPVHRLSLLRNDLVLFVEALVECGGIRINDSLVLLTFWMNLLLGDLDWLGLLLGLVGLRGKTAGAW